MTPTLMQTPQTPQTARSISRRPIRSAPAPCAVLDGRDRALVVCPPMPRFHVVVAVLLASLSLVACEAPGVGDPCEPEEVPENGFQETEVYLETRSLQCRTRVCMVNHLRGDPRIEDPQ